MDQKEGGNKQDMAVYLGYILKGVKQMYKNLDAIHTIAKINQAGNEKKIVNLEELVKSIKEQNTSLHNNRNILIQKKLPSIFGSYFELNTLFRNLIENGLKFNRNELPKIEINCSNQNGCYRFFIKDNGIGISQEYKDQIFKMFKRLNNRKDFEGAGVGLAVCKKIVEKHGGEIWLEESGFNGSTFGFTILDVANKVES